MAGEPPIIKSYKRIPLVCSCFIAAAIFYIIPLQAQSTGWLVDSAINLIDGLNPIYKNVHPGDTIYLKAGNRNKLLIRNFKGALDSPVVFMNKDGVVNISTNDYYGISIVNCRYIRLSGEGSSNFYGIKIVKVLTGSGMGIGSMSSDIEVDHVSIENCSIGGIYFKTDPDCSNLISRDNFTQFNTSIHDNYIADVGNEGMYIGSSYYLGMMISCSGKDTVIKPPVLDGVKIYNNIVKNTGWDGIQVGSAPLHCQIFNNTVLNDSQAEVPNQMSGILMGGGSKCDCNNNFISDGKGDGIENHGLGGNRIFNNIIVNAGRSYKPTDLTQMKHGIFVSDVSVIKDAAFYIFFNDIINPKSDGIRFQSIKSKHSLISSNVIINPGNFNLYETDNTPFNGQDAYVMAPIAGTDVQLKNNNFSRTITEAGISSVDYTILPGSPLINSGYPYNNTIQFDFRNHRRPAGGLYDIGAMEYDAGSDTLLHTFNERPLLFPNPVHSLLNIKYLSINLTKTVFTIYAVTGALVLQQYNQVIIPGIQELQIPVSKFATGIYVYSIQNGKEITYGKFIKI